LLQHPLQNVVLDRGECRRTAGPRPCEVHASVERDTFALHQQDPSRKRHGFLHVVCHEQRREAMLAPKPFDEFMHFDACEQRRIGPRGSIEQTAHLS
jgi:hypothetical protein